MEVVLVYFHSNNVGGVSSIHYYLIIAIHYVLIIAILSGVKWNLGYHGLIRSTTSQTSTQ